MHPSALLSARNFFSRYSPSQIVELGSLRVYGGAMRDVAPATSTYMGLDLVAGDGVDVVMDDPYSIPLPTNHADAIVATSTFEHCPLFWLLFVEMVRVTLPGGHIYVNAPSNGPVHRYPVDCWRFYPDAGQALTEWAGRSNWKVEVVETAISPPDDADPARWEDWWCVWRKLG